jgi:hypothetical protein
MVVRRRIAADGKDANWRRPNTGGNAMKRSAGNA